MDSFDFDWNWSLANFHFDIIKDEEDCPDRGHARVGDIGSIRHWKSDESIWYYYIEIYIECIYWWWKKSSSSLYTAAILLKLNFPRELRERAIARVSFPIRIDLALTPCVCWTSADNIFPILPSVSLCVRPIIRYRYRRLSLDLLYTESSISSCWLQHSQIPIISSIPSIPQVIWFQFQLPPNSFFKSYKLFFLKWIWNFLFLSF